MIDNSFRGFVQASEKLRN